MLLSQEPGRYSILIADDNAIHRESLREIVAPEGFQTVLAENGEEAVDIIQVRPVHLLLCDMHMPRLNGLETLQLARQFNAVLPCILVSGDVSEQLMRRALVAKAFSVIAKPVSKNVLLYTVVRALVKSYERSQAPRDPGLEPGNQEEGVRQA
jgi:CheY-like chemotaxis protein